MIAKQYTIQLPADYDMEIVRERVRRRGEAFDGFPGLALKAFLISEKTHGATANRYAPFYLWNHVSGANEFLYGDGFAALIDTFGRPLIEHWLVADVKLGDTSSVPLGATREDWPIAGASLAASRDAQRDWLEQCTGDHRGLCLAVVALDPWRWRFVRFALWHTPSLEGRQPDSITAFEVLHLSAPTPLRQWSAGALDPS